MKLKKVRIMTLQSAKYLIKELKLINITAVMIIIFLLPLKADAFNFEANVSRAKALSHYIMGNIYDLTGTPNRAILEYESAAQFDEGSYLIHLRRGTDYARLNMLEDAKQALYLVNKYNPEEMQAHYLLALIYSAEKEYDKAALEYEIILKNFSAAEPKNIEIYGYLGQLYYSQRKYDEAIKQFEKIYELEPENTEVMYVLGSLYSEIDEFDKAVSVLNRCLDIDPQHDGSMNTLGYLYAEKGINLDEAQQLVEAALKISPNNGAYLDSLGWVYFKKNQNEKALETLQQASNVLEDPVIYEHIGDVLLKMNKKEEALKSWQHSLDLLPEQEKIIKKIQDIKNIQALNNL